jgi:hypothetical protein
MFIPFFRDPIAADEVPRMRASLNFKNSQLYHLLRDAARK